MLQKTTLAIISLVVSGFAFAGMYSPAPAPTCTPGDVIVPCAEKRWDIGAQALYLQPTYSADKGYEFNSQQGYNKVSPQGGWAYRLEGSYHFSTGNDLIMTFIHFDNKTNRSGYAGSIPFAFAVEPFNMRMDNRFDQVNLVMGQYVDMSVWQKLRFYSGLQYAQIRVDTTNNYTVVPAALRRLQVTGVNEYRNTDFDGAGPTFGLDYAYNLVNGFSLTANSAASLLYGASRYNSGFALNPTGLVLSPFHHSQKTVIPGLEAKLGLSYVHEWVDGTLSLAAGFQAINYFNVIETRRVIAHINRPEASNFSLFGPYFGAKWIGYV